MTEGLSRGKRRKINTRNKIIRASYKTFSKKGLFRATLDQITEEADVGKALFTTILEISYTWYRI